MDGNSGPEAPALPESTQVSHWLLGWRALLVATLSLPAAQKFLSVGQERGGQRPRVELQSLSTRAYLDHTVVPILLDAMAAVAKER